MESLVIDAVMRGEVDESIRTRAAALGWGEVTDIVVLVGGSPSGSDEDDPAAAVAAVHSTARRHDLPVLTIEALARLRRALGELIVDGVDTTIPLFRALLEEPDILSGNYSIHWLERWLAEQQF